MFAAITAGTSVADASVIIPEPTLQLEKSARTLDDYKFKVSTADNFYAAFDFYIEEISAVANNTVLAGYWESRTGVSRIFDNALIFVKNGDNLTLKVGRGKLSSTTLVAARRRRSRSKV